AMVAIDGHCVDATPVTQAQYEGFRGSVGPDPSGQRAGCEWNLTYNLDVDTCGQFDSEPPYNPALYPNRPAVCVDWCDAAAYCTWAGKQLCGGRDGSAIAIATGDAPTVTSSEWLFACTQGGLTAYPYGAEHTQACGQRGDTLHDVGALPYCHGQAPPYTLLLDMNGAILEWEDACIVDGAGDSSTVCRTIGGDACNGAFAGDRRAGFDDHRGFRCCAE
ncbi:MAG: formylglycine-generating enzyme family protein, partial [Polyangiales bacterium]